MNKKVQIVTSALIQNQNKFLIVKRAADETFLPNMWELPGGKVEPEENPNISVLREIQEECGLKIAVIKPGVINSYVSKERNIHYVEIFYLCTIMNKTDEVKLSEEHSEYQWISKGDLENFKFEMTEYMIDTINTLYNRITN
ncbi:MAG: NUDIX hydrolase [Candidatus Levybacteria bacterium]|nr:NUDIX hydrolase [Candidatus Levybacteria bacterium]